MADEEPVGIEVSQGPLRAFRNPLTGTLMKNLWRSMIIGWSFVFILTFMPHLKPAQGQEGKIVPYVPTPQEVVERMLELAQVKKGDIVYDLGSGDGRIVITAAQKYGVRAIGFEIDPERIKESQENIKKAGVGNLVEIRQQDIRTVDLSPASVLTMYLLPEVNLMIRPKIWKQMKPGSRIVSHDFDMGDWKPLKTENIKDGHNWDHTLYLWHVEAGKK
jgi:hypothetical protein